MASRHILRVTTWLRRTPMYLLPLFPHLLLLLCILHNIKIHNYIWVPLSWPLIKTFLIIIAYIFLGQWLSCGDSFHLLLMNPIRYKSKLVRLHPVMPQICALLISKFRCLDSQVYKDSTNNFKCLCCAYYRNQSIPSSYVCHLTTNIVE